MKRIPTRLLRGTLILIGMVPVASGQSLEDLTVGHFLEVRGTLVGERFVAEQIEILEPDDDELLIGTVAPEGLQEGRFLLLGQPVSVSASTRWSDVGPDVLAGRRVKVKGHWFGPARFSGREISARDEGRDRLIGRADAIERVEDGVEIALMRFRVFAADGTEVRCASEPATIALSPAREITAPEKESDNEDDLFGEGIPLVGTLRLFGQLEWRTTVEEDFDLDTDEEEDRIDDDAGLRARLSWSPTPRLHAQAELRYSHRWRDDEEDGFERSGDADLGETFVYVQGMPFAGLDFQVGRQDFDDEREWIYDKNLDALRLIAERSRWRLELALSTTLTEGTRRDRNSTNLSGYLTGTGDDRRLALWALHRDFDLDEEEQGLWLGARALGSFVPRNESWFDVATLHGRRGDTDVAGWGYDVGSTWTPPIADDRFSLTLGYAFGSGDDDPDGSHDGTFRQTGLQDNNDKLAGVTSFRYYGELFEPELANLGVLTVGVGFDLFQRTSLDVVFHQYTQDRLRSAIVDGELDMDPSGTDGDLGFELDAILGSRRFANWDFELVGAWFHPGDAFDGADDAYLGKLQLRYRF